jgi:hypothetical protein
MVLDEDEPVVQLSAPAPKIVQDPVIQNQKAREAVKRVSHRLLLLILLDYLYFISSSLPGIPK